MAAASSLLGQQLLSNTDSKDDNSEAYASGDAESVEEKRPAKRMKLSVASTSESRKQETKAASKSRKKSLSLLPTMPMDVLFEILRLLTPKDLLNVLCTNKLFRGTLLSSGSKTVWKYALKAQNVPECPADLIEPRWASLLFGNTCECCGAKNIHKIDFYLRRRVCTTCKKANLLVKFKVGVAFPDYDETILELIPSTNVGGWAHGHKSSSKFFWRSDIEDMMHQLATYNQKKHMRVPGAQNELKVFTEQRIERVQDIQSTAVNFHAWFEKKVEERSDEIAISKVTRVQAVMSKFIELGYEEEDLSFLDNNKECNQKAALTDLIWKRIRPILEPEIECHRDARLARYLKQAKKNRRTNLSGLYTEYKASIPPSQWKLLPHILEVSKAEPFKSLIKAKYDVEITADDFKPLMPQIPKVVEQIQKDLKAQLVQKLTDALRPDKSLPSNCLDLATSVFSCNGALCSVFSHSLALVVGSDDAISHNCGPSKGNHVHSSYTAPGTPKKRKTRDFMVHPVGAVVAKSLVLCAGLVPEKALAFQMDYQDLRFACNACTNGKPLGYSWRTALLHWSQCHTAENPLPTSWRVLNSKETAMLKQNEAKDGKWAQPEWQCCHCPVALTSGGMTRDAIEQHLNSEHGIASPTIPADLFYFETVASPFRWESRLFYATPPPPPPPKPPVFEVKNKICLCCHSGGWKAQRRLFDSGIRHHLESKHSIKNGGVEGVHWKKVR
ncbi:hypothetical protein BDN70DRAFT_882141 [Pholiota conissans]|uniref:F-box domain-containing protein n=1 Tax=Pholiota conissans TaxID=109636 RepID=A0A9P6CR64_9AGAR|nr:hypothetical protein BDN70DRAFT_882141 [Pholiota conissans]